MNIQQAYQAISQEQVPYYRKYTYDKPLIMSIETYEKTKLLGKVLNKAILYFVEHYSDYQDIMPLDERTMQILSICEKYPFRTGMYRTDFVIDQNSRLKIIEMTTRQPLNGYFISGFTSQIGEQESNQLGIKEMINDYPRFLQYLQDDFFKSKKVRIIKGNERLGDFKTYCKLFSLADDIDYKVIDLENIFEERVDLYDAMIIEELNFPEIKALPDDLIEQLTAGGIHNDFRNILLVHDKRFFEVLTESRFMEAALTQEEQHLLKEFTIPSYSIYTHPEIFANAYISKDDWIIKPYNCGKSEGVKAGCVTSKEEWESQFKSDSIGNMILQPMVRQRKFHGTIGDEGRDDYIVGTLLYFNDEYYGPGIYRASSYIVTNIIDDRKVAQVVAVRDNSFADITI